MASEAKATILYAAFAGAMLERTLQLMVLGYWLLAVVAVVAAAVTGLGAWAHAYNLRPAPDTTEPR